MLRCRFSCTSTHASCYAVDSLALPDIRHATLSLLLHFYTCARLSCWMFSPYEDDNNDNNDNNENNDNNDKNDNNDNNDNNENNDNDDDDDVVDIADYAKVSFLSLFNSPLNMFEK